MSNRCVVWVAVLILVCVLMCVGSAMAALTVEITTPDTDPYLLGKDVEQKFEAAAYVDGQELDGGQVSWAWDFADASATQYAYVNPAYHTFTEYGIYYVEVTAQYQGQTASDEVEVIVSAAGHTEGGGSWSPQAGWWLMNTEVMGGGSVSASAINGYYEVGDNAELSVSGDGWSVYGRAMMLGWGSSVEAMVDCQLAWADIVVDSIASVNVNQTLAWQGPPGKRPIHGKYTAIALTGTHCYGNATSCFAQALSLAEWAGFSTWLPGNQVYTHEDWWDESYTFMTGACTEAWIHSSGALWPNRSSGRVTGRAHIVLLGFEVLQ